jgi:tripartite-type tricarboxylate transporter receptor subunit TctC
MRSTSVTTVFALIIASVLCVSAPAHAQSAQNPVWPLKPVRLIIPFGPGGAADTFGRVLAAKLPDSLGQNIIADNRAGAGGLIGSEAAAKSAPDGYTLVISGLASHVLAPTLAARSPFDPVREVTHIALFGGPPAVFGIHPSLPAKSLREFVALAKVSAQDLVFGSPGNGTLGHLFGVLFTSRAGIRIEHIPYKSASGAVLDIAAGHIHSISTTLSTAAPQIRAGRIRALAISAPERIREFGAVPTFRESGYPELIATIWFGLAGPAGLPSEIVQRLNAEVRQILAAADVQERLRVNGMVIQALSVPATGDFIAAEFKRWTPVIRSSGARPG